VLPSSAFLTGRCRFTSTSIFLFNGTELPRQWTDGVEIIGDKRPPTFLAQCHLNFDISIFLFWYPDSFEWKCSTIYGGISEAKPMSL
jgi:hypothetical protein